MQAIVDIRSIFTRQTNNQIHIDNGNAALAYLFVGTIKIIHAVATPNHLQRFIMKGLRIDANAVHPRRLHGCQLIRAKAVRSTGLHGELCHLRKMQMLAHHL